MGNQKGHQPFARSKLLLAWLMMAVLVHGAISIDLISPASEPVPLIGPITVQASETAPCAGIVKHQYTWLHSPLITATGPIDQPPTSCVSSDTFVCDAANCADKVLSVHVDAIDADGKVVESADRLLLFPGVEASLQQPFLRLPPKAFDNESFTLRASNGYVLASHDYKWRLTRGTQTEEGEQTVTDDNGDNQTEFVFDCTADRCRGAGISFMVQAVLAGGERSKPSMVTIYPIPPPLGYEPQVKELTVNGALDEQKTNELQTFHSTTIEGDKSFSLTVGPPDGKNFDTYHYETFKNDVSLGSTTVSGSMLTINPVSCPGCVPDDSLTYRIIGEYKTVKSGELVASFVVPRPSGMVEGSTAGGLCDNGAWLSRWLPLMGLAWGGLIAFIALVYMLGTAFHVPQMLDWSKTEIGQAVLGVGMLTVILWLMSLQCNLKIGEFAGWAGVPLGPSSAIGLQNDDTMTQAALKGLEWSLKQTHIGVALIRHELGVLNIRATFTMSATEVGGIGGNGIQVSPLAGEWTNMGSLQMLLNLNTTFVLALLFQYFSLLIFSSMSGLFMFLVPLGLILRCMPYLRGFGGGLVAIGLGFYIFYPMFLALEALMLPPVYATLGDDSSIAGASDVGAITRSERDLTGTSIDKPYFYSLPDLTKKLDGLEKADCHEGRCYYTIDLAPLFNMTALNFIRAVLVPSAGILVIVSFVRDLSALFGEEVEASKLAQMV